MTDGRGEVDLDEIDLAILRGCASGKAVREIATELGVGRDVVNRRLHRVRTLWDVPNTVAAVVVAVRRGLI